MSKLCIFSFKCKAIKANIFVIKTDFINVNYYGEVLASQRHDVVGVFCCILISLCQCKYVFFNLLGLVVAIVTDEFEMSTLDVINMYVMKKFVTNMI